MRAPMIPALATTMPSLDGALCVHRPDIFTPEVIRNNGDIKKAKAICGHCPAADPCLAWALENRTVIGVLGGTTYSERKRLMKWKRLA